MYLELNLSRTNNIFTSTLFVVVQLLSHVQLFVTPWTAAWQVSLSFTISCSLLKLMSIESVMPCNHLILWCFFLLLASVFPSIRIFSSELALQIRWWQYWNFSISPANDPQSIIIPFTCLIFLPHNINLLLPRSKLEYGFPVSRNFVLFIAVSAGPGIYLLFNRCSTNTC